MISPHNTTIPTTSKSIYTLNNPSTYQNMESTILQFWCRLKFSTKMDSKNTKILPWTISVVKMDSKSMNRKLSECSRKYNNIANLPELSLDSCIWKAEELRRTSQKRDKFSSKNQSIVEWLQKLSLPWNIWVWGIKVWELMLWSKWRNTILCMKDSIIDHKKTKRIKRMMKKLKLLRRKNKPHGLLQWELLCLST